MVVKTYICDRCKRKVEENGLQEVTVSVKEARGSAYYNYNVLNRRAEWCGDCCTETGMVLSKMDIVPDKKYPTLEEMIRDVIREEMAVCYPAPK
jgi:hypothetical protein